MKSWREHETAFYQELSERLRVARRTLRITEREAADAAGVTIGTYRKWEKGGHVRGMDPLNNLCDELEVSVCWLLDGFGGFLAEDDDEFLPDEFLARRWRERLAAARRRSAEGSLAGSCWIGAVTDAGCVYFKNRRH